MTKFPHILARFGAAAVVLLAAASALGQAVPQSQPYTWKSVQMVGGGFVDGIIFHPTAKGLSYARTDIGGAYRRDDQHAAWVPITDWVSLQDNGLLGIESIALDPHDADKVYMAAGMYPNQRAAILRSGNRGKTFERTYVPFSMGGNSDGRGNGERLMVDPNQGKILYMGTRSAGLWRSADGAVTWANVASFPTISGGAPGGRGGAGAGSGVIFVVFDPRSGGNGKASSTIYAGASLVGQESIFVSKDAGATWVAIPGQATALRPTHGVWASDGTLYVSYSTVAGPATGTDGAVWKYAADAGTWTNITPVANPGCGYAAVAVDAAHPQTLIASTSGKRGGEEIYRSIDAGKTWRPLINNPQARAVYDFTGHPYTAHTGIHWLWDIEIDPFDSNHAMFTVGYGGWETFNQTDADAGKPVRWVTDSMGIEETVALALWSPPEGSHLITGIGDYGGFVNNDLDKPAPEGNFTNPFFSNTSDVSGAWKNPNVVVRVGASGGGQNTGARSTLGYSLDAGKTWQPPKTAPAGNGFVAVSADGTRWIAGGGGNGGGRGGGAPAETQVTQDRGDTWTACAGLPVGVRVVADTVDPKHFYAMNTAGALFASADGGATFTQSQIPLPAPARGGHGDNRGGQDRLYATPDIAGDLWFAAFDGLFHSVNAGKSFEHLPLVLTQLACLGFGQAAPGASYPALYTVATIGGVHGVFRSDDVGKTWMRINDDAHQWGLILQISGDPRIYGRVYVGTHGRGVLYGDIK